jgi:hypothetical protein
LNLNSYFGDSECDRPRVGDTVLVVWTHPKRNQAKVTLSVVTRVAGDHIHIDGISHAAYPSADTATAADPDWTWVSWHKDRFEADTPDARAKYGVPLDAVPLTPRPVSPHDHKIAAILAAKAAARARRGEAAA